jgi:hypothetical protein
LNASVPALPKQLLQGALAHTCTCTAACCCLQAGPWWEKYYKNVFPNRAVRDEARKRDGIVISRPIHRGRLDEEPDMNERFEVGLALCLPQHI